MFNYFVLCGVMYGVVTAEPPVGIANGIKPLNVLGGPEQHASFSFIRPGLTQTSFSFHGPSSHQAFSSSIGNSQLAQRVLPNVANALSYRNPGLGYFANVPISMGFASSPHASGPLVASPATSSLPYNQFSLEQSDLYNNQLNQLLALRQAQMLQHSIQGQSHHLPSHQSQANEELQLQHQDPHHQQPQQYQPQSLLGVAYSSAPAVSHVKIHGHGYKYNF